MVELVQIFSAIVPWAGSNGWVSIPFMFLVVLVWSQWNTLKRERRARDDERIEHAAQMMELNQEHDRFALEMSKRFDGIVAIITDNKVMQEIRAIELDIQSKTVEIKAMIQASFLTHHRRD